MKYLARLAVNGCQWRPDRAAEVVAFEIDLLVTTKHFLN